MKIPARGDTPTGACEVLRNVSAELNNTFRELAVTPANVVHKNLLLQRKAQRQDLPLCAGRVSSIWIVESFAASNDMALTITGSHSLSPQPF
jgi:hypothetical protein